MEAVIKIVRGENRAMAKQELITIPDMATIANISVRAAWMLVWQRKLPSIKMGRLRRVRRTDLDAYLSKCTVPVQRTN